MVASRFLSGFEIKVAALPDLNITYAHAGSGPPILLLHGHPQTHVAWRKVAPLLVDAGFSVIASDLRGYGDSDKLDSDKLDSDATHLPYAKRTMAQDQIALMHHLGFETFSVVGHDRGGRVAHRLALDFPDAVERTMVLDIAPTHMMYAQTNQDFATRYFWWFFLIQPKGLPEAMIGADPEYFLRHHLARQVKIDGSITEEIITEYLRTYKDPSTLHAICEDYRAAASIDLEHDEADMDHRVTSPLRAIWGEHSVVGDLYDVIATWQDKGTNVSGASLPCGHAIPEEAPVALADEIIAFMSET